ncbi:mobilization protein [Bacteroidia bacterium]|nr:mobilization protein [Bacteroidia bacterium]GHT61560.1 mobilization protein [Bacteroidia bacterium]
MEESKELQQLYTLFRGTIYVSVLLEIAVFIPFPFLEKIGFILDRIANWGIYHTLFYSKMATLLVVCLTCVGTRAQKTLEFNAKRMVIIPVIFGLILIWGSVVLYPKMINFILFGLPINWIFYIILSIVGVISVHIGLDNLSKMIKSGLGKDRFNLENESFQQQDKKIENQYSINIPTLYYYKGKYRRGWINIVNPFRGTWVLGTPGSGKTFSIIEPVMRQHAAKGFAMVVYDYKFPTLGRKLFYLFEKNKKLGKTPPNCKFHVINFTEVEYSRRVNPIQKKYIPTMGAASETASTLIESLQKGGKENSGGSDDFFKKSAENFLAAIIYFFIRYEDGKYADMPHVLSFLNEEYTTIFDVLMTDDEIYPLLAPFKTALKNKAMDQLEGMAGTLRVYASRLATKEAYWVFSGDDFDLKVSDPQNPSYLLIANDPEMENITGSLNALILNRLVTRVNSGEGKNVPVDIIIDELPTLYFHKIDRLIGTARSNKVAVTLGFQELTQLEADYGKIGMQKVVTVCANVICASARYKDTLEWLQNDIFGKVKQIKEGISITKSQTTISLNENMDNLIPAAKIADMPTGFLCGQTARDFIKTKTGMGGRIDIQKSEEFQTTKFYAKTDFDMNEIKKEENNYVDLPKFYNFGSLESKEQILSTNFRRINKEVKEMCDKILGKKST